MLLSGPIARLPRADVLQDTARMAVILTGKPFGSELGVELMPVPLGSSRKP